MSRVLLIEQDQGTRTILTDVLRTEGYKVTAAPTFGDALEQVVCEDFSLVVADISADHDAGAEFVTSAKAQQSTVPIIIIVDPHKGIEGLSKQDVFGRVTKPLKMAKLLTLVQKAMDFDQEAVKELQAVKLEVETTYPYKDIVAESDAMKEVCDMIGRVAATKVAVLIVGAPGTGKRLVARAIHDNGPRKDKGYIPIDCSVEPVDKLENALFGDGVKPGSFDLARGGTMVLMGIDRLPMSMQEKLVDVFNAKSFTRFGLKKGVELDVRVIATARGALDEGVKAGTFSSELARVMKLTIVVPPLKEHKEDIPPLIARTLRHEIAEGNPLPAVEPGATTLLENFPWPGNVVQLEDAVRSAVRSAKGGPISIEALKPFLSEVAEAHSLQTQLKKMAAT